MSYHLDEGIRVVILDPPDEGGLVSDLREFSLDDLLPGGEGTRKDGRLTADMYYKFVERILYALDDGKTVKIMPFTRR